MGQKMWGHPQDWPCAITGEAGSDSGHPAGPGRANVTVVRCHQPCCDPAQGYSHPYSGSQWLSAWVLPWIMSLGAKTRPWALTPTLTWGTWKEPR